MEQFSLPSENSRYEKAQKQPQYHAAHISLIDRKEGFEDHP